MNTQGTWGHCMYSISLWIMDIQNPWESVEFCRRVVVWVVDYMRLIPRVKSGISWCPAASDQALVAFGSVSLPSNLSQHAMSAVMSSIHHTSDRWSTDRISARPSVSALANNMIIIIIGQSIGHNNFNSQIEHARVTHHFHFDRLFRMLLNITCFHW